MKDVLPTADTLEVAFDYSGGKEETALIVGRISGDKISVLKIFHGEEAEVLYKTLTWNRRTP